MLTQLRIVDFAIIEQLELSFGPGFTVFTGETGAGKSIIIEAVELLLGGRAEAAMLREGAELALIEGVFETEPDGAPEVQSLLRSEDLIEDPGVVVLAREIRRQGRNLCRINGRVVSLGLLKSVGDWLVDVHGQSEHLSLLNVREHLPLLDRFAHSDLADYSETYRRLRATRKEREALESSERENARREDLLRYQINEIEAAALRPDEIADLVTERDRLANAEKLAGLALNALGALEASESTTLERSFGAAQDRLDEASGSLASLGEIDPSMSETAALVQGLTDEVSLVAVGLREYLADVQPDPPRLDEMESRLGLVHDLQRKYGDDVEAILAYAETAGEELESIIHAEERLEGLRAEEAEALDQVAFLGERLSRSRGKAAIELSNSVAAQLTELSMEDAQFGVELDWEDDDGGVLVDGRKVEFGPSGLDKMEFLVAPNVGEGLKPLAKIASGGETSRLMLGLKSALAKADQRPTLIFDEIDQGIGGRVGTVVGRKLKDLSQNHQVLCVTHLPQLAAYADRHFQVEKRVKSGRTLTAAFPLEGEQRLAELADMLGEASEANMRSARSLLQHAELQKASPVEPSAAA